MLKNNQVRPWPRRNGALSLVAVLSIIFIGLGAVIDPHGATKNFFPGSGNARAAPEVGSPAPDFELSTPEGKTIRLSSLRGQGVLINFWATWCGPCRSEMPIIQTMYHQNHNRGFTVVGIDMREDPLQVKSFMDQLGVDFPTTIDPKGDVIDAYRVVNIPASFFVDPKGIIRARYSGPMSRAVMEASLEGVLP